jgi:hypothetical protein
MRKLNPPPLRTDERAISELYVTYLKSGDDYVLEVMVLRPGTEVPMVKYWPVIKSVVHNAQLDDIGLWIGSAVASSIAAFLPVRGLAPGT